MNRQQRLPSQCYYHRRRHQSHDQQQLQQQYVYIILIVAMMMINNIVYGQQCNILDGTNTDALGPFYNKNSPIGEYIGPIDHLNNNAKRLEVTGRILSIKNCNSSSTDPTAPITYYPVSNVTIEIWYAGEPDAAGNYYQSNNYRGQVNSDICGNYYYIQAFPQQYPGRPLIHVHIRVSDNNNKSGSSTELLVTQMYFIGTDIGYYTDTNVQSERRIEQAVHIRTDDNGIRHVQFDILVDYDGNEECSLVNSTTSLLKPSTSTSQIPPPTSTSQSSPTSTSQSSTTSTSQSSSRRFGTLSRLWTMGLLSSLICFSC